MSLMRKKQCRNRGGMNKEFLKNLCTAAGIASNETQVRAVLRRECKEFADKVAFDGIGSMVFTQEGEGPCILLAAHLDEVGFMVRSVSSQGMLMVLPVGNVRVLSRFMQEVCITTSDGSSFTGVLNATYDAVKQEAANMYIDLGQDSRQDIENMGIRPGDMVTFSSGFREYENGRFAAKALDDRAGCYVLGEVMKRMAHTAHPNRICYAFTSSEEVGTRGAGTAARLAEPDICIVLDVACHNNEFVRDHTNNRQLGRGPMLVHYDKTAISSRRMVSQVRHIAKNHGISIQDDMFLNGGTDAGVLHQHHTGCPTVVLGIPSRYGHSPYSIACYQDLEDTVELVYQMLTALNTQEYHQIRFEGEKDEI